MISLQRAFTILAISFFSCALHAQEIWVGNANPNNNWSAPANWQDGSAPLSNADLHFQGSNQTTNNNDLNSPQGYSIGSLTFDANAASFELTGVPIRFFNMASPNSITNNSANSQILGFSDGTGSIFRGISFQADFQNFTIDAASGNFVINANIGLYKPQTTGGDLIFTGAHNITVNGLIDNDPSVSRAARIIKNGTGTLSLNNNNLYRNDTVINAGVLVVGATNALGVQDPGMFVEFNDVFLNGGTLRTDAPRTFVAPHDYTHTAGTLQLQIGGLNSGVNADLMQIANNADLGPNLGSNLFIHQFGGFIPVAGDRVTVITAGGAVSGTFDTFADDFPGLITATPEYFSDHVDIVFDVGSFAGLPGLTRNQQSVGEALDHALAEGCAVPLTTFLVGLPLGDLPDAYDLIAPEELAAIYDIGFANAEMHGANFQRRLSDIRVAARGYCEAAPVVETYSGGKGATEGGKVVLSDKNAGPVVETCPDRRWAIFATGSGQWTETGDDDVNARGYDIGTGSLTTGVDYLVNQHFAVGIGGGYSHSTADLVNGGEVDVSAPFAALYASVFSGGFYVDAQASGGWNDYNTTRVTLGGFEAGTTDGAEFSGLIAGGYDWKFGCFTFGPAASFQYTYVEFDSFTEGDSTIAALHFPDQNQEAAHSALGLKLTYEAKQGNTILRPEIRVAWQHEFGDRPAAIDAQFVDCDDVFRVWGPSTGENSALVDAGFSLIFGRCHNVAAYVFYNGNLGRENYDRHSANGGLRVSF